MSKLYVVCCLVVAVAAYGAGYLHAKSDAQNLLDAVHWRYLIAEQGWYVCQDSREKDARTLMLYRNIVLGLGYVEQEEE